MATTTVTNLSKRVYPQGVNLTSATIKCALFTSAQTGLTAAATTYGSLTGEVAAGSGYSTGGNTVGSLAWTGTTTPQITGTIPNWTGASFSFEFAVIYDTGTGDIIEYCDFGGTQTVVNGTVAISFGANGMLQVTSS